MLPTFHKNFILYYILSLLTNCLITVFCVLANSDDRKVPKLRSTIKNLDQVKTSSNGSCKFHTEPPASTSQGTRPISTDASLQGFSSSRVLAHQQPYHEKKHSSPPKTLAGHRNPRAGVSFCFSRRAQLKLDSCASVFSDGLEEANDSLELQRHRQRLALEALWSCSSSPRTPCNDDTDPSHNPPALVWADGDFQRTQMEAQTEHVESLEFQLNCSTSEPGKLICPDTHGPGSNDGTAGSEDRLVDRGQRPRAEGAYGGSEEKEWPSPSAQSQLLTHKNSLPHTEKNSKEDIMQNGEKGTENIHLVCEDENTDWSSKAPVSFLNVLSKEGNTLKWPSELVQYTSDKQRISYSCNPVGCFFKHREGKEKSTKPVDMEFGVERLAGHNDRSESQTQNVPGDKLGILKPKRPKHMRKGKTRRCKLDAVRSRQALKTCSQTEAGGHFEFQSAPADTSQHKQPRAERRHKLGKRRSVRDETSNESDTPEHSLKSIIVSSLSAPARKRKKCQTVRRLVPALHLGRGRPFPYSLHYTTGRENYGWNDNTYESKRDAASTPNSDKSGSWSGLSDMTSDGEWPVYHPRRRLTSPRSKPWRKEHGKSCIRNSSQNIPYHSYRHISDSLCRDFRDFEHAGDCWDYTDLCIYDKRKYSAVYDNPDQNEKYNIRRHKRFVEEHRNKEHIIQDNSRLFYRVYDSPDPQDDIRDWWSENLIPVTRRHREREEYSWSSPERSQDRWYNKPASIRSPSLTSSTSVSDVSGEWMHHFRPSPSRQRQKRNHSAEKLVKTKFSHSPLRKETHSPSLAPSKIAAQPNSLKSSSWQGDITQKSSDQLVENEVKVKKANSALPLIGKLPSIKKGAKKMGINKDASGSTGNHFQTTTNPQVTPQKALLQHTEEQNSKAEACTAPKPDSFASQKRDIRDQENDKVETAGIHCARCTTPPLSEQPITFTEEEIEKYKLLQLQAQQHMQQQHLQEQQEIEQTSVDMSHIPTPEPANQNAPSAYLPYSLLQPSPSSPVTLLPLHPSLSQPHFSPSLPAAFFPAPPATVLAAHPLHLIPASALHPVHPHHHIRGLAFRPLPPGALLPTMLSPIPMAAAAAAGTLQIHPLLHSLFHSQDLQRRTS